MKILHDLRPQPANADHLDSSQIARTSILRASDRFLARFVKLWLVCAVVSLANWFAIDISNPIVPVAMIIGGLVAWWSIRVGNSALARYTLIGTTCFIVIFVPYIVSGVRTSALFIWPTLILMTGWFLGKRSAVGISVVAFVSIAILGLLEISGAYTFPVAVRSPQVWWTSLSIVCLFTGVVVWHLVGNYEFVQSEEVSLRQKLDAALAERERQLEVKTYELNDTSATLGNIQTEFEKAYPLAMLAAVVPAVAHDLATPVGNAQLAASTLTDHIVDFTRKLESGNLRRSDLEQHVRTMTEGVQIITSATDRTSHLVTSLKHMSIDQATQQRRHFDLATLLGEIGVTMAPTLKKSHVALATKFEAGLYMDSYPGPLGQVVSNLIQNCVVHGFDGKPSGTIWLRAMRLGQESAQIEVEDDGFGMTEGVKLRVFESFFTTKAGKGGSGVGLTLSQRLVEQTLGGSISVSSTAGVGTRFTLRIPLAAPISASLREGKDA